LKDHQHPIGGDARHPCDGGGDFGGEARDLGFRVALADPAADEDWAGRYGIGVDAVDGQFVETTLT